MAQVTAIASEIWSAPTHPVQRAAAWAFTEPDCLRERIRRSRSLHGQLARAVTGEFRAVGAEVPEPQAGFYLFPDFEPVRRNLRSGAYVDTGTALAAALLHEHAIATLPASAFGDPDSALRLRVATSLLYGDTDRQREAALDSPRPLELPWIAEHVRELRRGLTGLIGAAVEK